MTLDLHGKKFGLLTAMNASGKSGSNISWLCKCDCGAETEVRSSHLVSGATRSCGCLSGGRPTHGLRKAKEYKVWAGIKQRCYNKNNKSYQSYGAKGVSVCDAWRESFETFYADMGPRPTDNHTIDRIDPFGNYDPVNCRWILKSEQGKNKRDTVYFDVNGEKVSLIELAEKHGVPKKRLWARVFTYGWSLERALIPSAGRGK